MAGEPPKQRLLRLLRRTAKGTRAATDRGAADESALWSAHERALVRARDAGAAAQRIAANATRQRASIEAVSDRSRALASRAAETHAGFSRVIEAFDRLGLVALNAGLEGARMGEAEGRQLALVSDEVRAQTNRGVEAARELSALLAQLAADLAQLEGHVAQAQAVVSEVTQDSARAAGAALVDGGDRVKRSTGSDPETVRAVSEATEHARALVTTLSAMSGKVPRALIVGALSPVLAPLSRMLGDEEPEDESRSE